MARWLGFGGRIGRAQFWLGTVVIALLTAGTSFLALWIFGAPMRLEGPPGADGNANSAALVAAMMAVGVVVVVALYVFATLMVRRLHDRGQTGLWALIVLGPVALLTISGWLPPGGVVGYVSSIAALAFMAGLLWAVINLGLLPGEAGANAYGPDPRAAQTND